MRARVIPFPAGTAEAVAFVARVTWIARETGAAEIARYAQAKWSLGATELARAQRVATDILIRRRAAGEVQPSEARS